MPENCLISLSKTSYKGEVKRPIHTRDHIPLPPFATSIGYLGYLPQKHKNFYVSKAPKLFYYYQEICT
jgi:hypothetical protein